MSKIINFGEKKEEFPSDTPKVLLYHGSNLEIDSPIIVKGKYTKDFGIGFYLTNNEQQAVRFVQKFIRGRSRGVVNVYEYLPSKLDKLAIKIFPIMTEEWLDFIIDCRLGVEHEYDMVEGPMADDQIWNHVTSLVDGLIDREMFWKYAKFNYPTHQICLTSDISLESIKFERSYEVIV